MGVNPFSPGSVRSTEYFVGRTAELHFIEDRTDYLLNGLKTSPVCFLGPSGFGKTSLLTQASARLRNRLWICGYTEASSDTATAIEDLLTDIHRTLRRPNILKRALSGVQGFNASAGIVGFGLNLRDAQGGTSYERLVALLSALVKMSEQDGTGLFIFIDELQVLPDSEIEKIVRAAFLLRELPIAMVFSGLPSLTDIGAADRVRGHSTIRMEYHTLDPLTPHEAAAALTNPLASAGGRFDAEALEQVIEFASGHPLVVQILGSNAWTRAEQDAAFNRDRIVRGEHAKWAISKTQADLELAYYRPIWANCTLSERSLLTSLALTPSPPLSLRNVSDEQANITDDDPYAVAHKLIGKGIIFEFEERSADWDAEKPLRLVLPGFDNFIRLQAGWRGRQAGGDVPRRDPLPLRAERPDEKDLGVAEGLFPTVEGVDCKFGHFNDPEASHCRVCGVRMGETAAVRKKGKRPALGVLVLADGSVCELDADYVAGREPALDASVADGRARPLRLVSASGVVSRIHARVELDGWQVFISDLNSANGTEIHLPGERSGTVLQPGVRTPLVAGAQIRMGGEYVFRYDFRSAARITAAGVGRPEPRREP